MNQLQEYALRRLGAELHECETCGYVFDAELGGYVHRDEGIGECQKCHDARVAEFDWMIPHVRAAARAERDGDYAEARRITEACGVRYQGADS